DGPAAGANGCWQGTSGTCVFGNLSWTPPTGATCTGVGTLTAPCSAGTLVCQGAAKWACVGGVKPQPEACDGIDNDCKNGADDGNPGGGVACSPPGTILTSACAGTTVCTAGSLTCNGALPKTETCNNVDDDCDGLVDGADPDLAGFGGVCGSSVGVCKQGT